jgi:outer membrane protein
MTEGTERGDIMRKINRAALAGFLALALVAAAPAMAEEKIGVVDIDQALNSTDEGKAAREELSRKHRDAQGKLEPMFERFKALQEELKSKRFVLSEDALYQKQLDLVELKTEIDNRSKELEDKLKVDKERLEGPLRKKLIEIVEELGKEKGYTLILARGTGGMLYSREALDMTEMVIQRFNKKG